MRRILFSLWLLSSAVALFALGALIHPPVMLVGTAFLVVVATWMVAVVPLSFLWWFRTEHAREQALVSAALRAWHEGEEGAGILVARALELTLSEEDEVALCQLLDELAKTAPAQLDPALQPFVSAAAEWMADDDGPRSRREHLAQLKEAARPLLPALAVR